MIGRDQIIRGMLLGRGTVGAEIVAEIAPERGSYSENP